MNIKSWGYFNLKSVSTLQAHEPANKTKYLT